MSFLAPYVLWGSLAAGIPVAIHFFFRSRFRTIPWAAMEFLLQSVEQTSRRLRFQELLLLLMRVALLLLLAVALARPTTRAITGAGGEAVHCVLLLDNSMSMDGLDNGVSRWERAKAAARAVLDHLPAQSTTQIVTCSDRAEVVGPKSPSDLDEARKILDGLQVSGRGSDLAMGLIKAVDAMKKDDQPQRELYIFTDAQARAFERQPSALAEAAREARKLGIVYLARCGGELKRNATVLGIAPQAGIPHTGERLSFAVLVKNTGREPIRDLGVSLVTDGDEKTRESQLLPKLDPGETRAVTLSGRWADPGLRTITARLQPDDLAADNRFDQVLRVVTTLRVLIIDGAPGPENDSKKWSSYFLTHAVLPVKEADKKRHFLQARVVTPAVASPGQLENYDICILSNVALERDKVKPGEVLPEDFLEALYRYVRDGKTLLIFAGDRTQPASYNRLLHDRTDMLPLRLKDIHERAEGKEVGFDRGQLSDPTFAKFRDDEAYKDFGLVRTSKSIDGEAIPAESDRAPTQVLVRFTDGQPAIAVRSIGAGAVGMVTTSADLSWTDAPLRPSVFVPMVDSLLWRLLLADTAAHNTTTGAGIETLIPVADGESTFVLQYGDATTVLGKPARSPGGRPLISATNTPIGGLYQLRRRDAGSAGEPFAVVPDRLESEQSAAASDERIAEQFGFAPVQLTVTDDLSAFAGGERAKREWTPWLLWALLALAVSEAVFAWFVGRPK